MQAPEPGQRVLAAQHDHASGREVDPDGRLERFSPPHREGPRASAAGRVEVAAIRIAGALPAHQPVCAGIELEPELAAIRELPPDERAAGGALDPDVRQGTLDWNSITHPDLRDP
jgi:hypothetical protein